MNATNEILAPWQHAWRAAAPHISTAGLVALERALVTDDGRLMTGGTTRPLPIACVQDWPVEAACPLAFGGWIGDGLVTVGEVEEYFARLCYEIDQTLGERGGVSWLLNRIDETPRDTMRTELLVEVRASLAARRGAGVA